MAKGHSGPGTYIVVAVILAVVTYIEYYIVEFPLAWLGPTWTLIWLVVLSLGKFILVIWFFMHLRDDPKLYTGFFASGFVIAMGTFVAMVFMFLLPRAVSPVVAATQPPAVAHADDHDVDPLTADVRALIETDGRTRPLAQQADARPPKDQTLRMVPPADEREFAFVGTGIGEAPPEEELDEAMPAEVEEADEADEADEPVAAAEADTSYDHELGAQVYAQNCSGCHQPGGTGVPGAFPPLAGHVIEFFEVEGGRETLIDIVLYGLQGPITVHGANYNGFMPAWPQLSDEQVAAVLNHTAVGFADEVPAGFDALTPREVAAERGKNLAPADVLRQRQALPLE
jgi:mono/diheme cytochrome c family protein